MISQEAVMRITRNRSMARRSANAERYSEMDLLHVEAFLEDSIRDFNPRSTDKIDSGIRCGLAGAIGIIEQLRLNRRLADR